MSAKQPRNAPAMAAVEVGDSSVPSFAPPTDAVAAGAGDGSTRGYTTDDAGTNTTVLAPHAALGKVERPLVCSAAAHCAEMPWSGALSGVPVPPAAHASSAEVLRCARMPDASASCALTARRAPLRSCALSPSIAAAPVVVGSGMTEKLSSCCANGGPTAEADSKAAPPLAAELHAKEGSSNATAVTTSGADEHANA